MLLSDIDEELIGEKTCSSHFSPATCVLEIGGVIIPLCETCIEELKNELKKAEPSN